MSPTLLLINPAMRAHRSSSEPEARPGLARPGSSVGARLPNAGGMATMEPLALAYVAALTPRHWDVILIDEVMEEIPAGLQPDLVALTSLSTTVPRAYELARTYREMGVPVVLGGVHATLFPEEAARHVDVVYQGEAESGWPALIQDFEARDLKPRYQGGLVSLQGLPRPRRDLYRQDYFLQLISASRGCRHRCEFCSLWKLDGGRYRSRPPEEVWAELHEPGWPPRRRLWKQRPLLFTDENVFVDREWSLALFRGMARLGLNRPHAVQASLDVADDEELLVALRKSGCMTVLIGFESVSEESLRLMRKGVNLKIGVDHYKEKIARLHDHGLMSSGTFMFGNDGDDADIFQRTVDFVLDSGMDVAHFGLLTPTPGTDLFDRLGREGRLLYTDFPADYRRYDLRTAVFRPRNMSPEKLEEGVLWATKAIGGWSVVLRRAWHTWQETQNPLYVAIACGWNRSGLYHRMIP